MAPLTSVPPIPIKPQLSEIHTTRRITKLHSPNPRFILKVNTAQRNHEQRHQLKPTRTYLSNGVHLKNKNSPSPLEERSIGANQLSNQNLALQQIYTKRAKPQWLNTERQTKSGVRKLQIRQRKGGHYNTLARYIARANQRRANWALSNNQHRASQSKARTDYGLAPPTREAHCVPKIRSSTTHTSAPARRHGQGQGSESGKATKTRAQSTTLTEPRAPTRG